MTWRICKYEIPLENEFEIEMQAIAEILKVGMYGELPHIWAITELSFPIVKHKFKAFATDGPIPDGPLFTKPPLRTVDIQQKDGSMLRYIDSFKHNKSHLSETVWHLFKVIEKKRK